MAIGVHRHAIRCEGRQQGEVAREMGSLLKWCVIHCRSSEASPDRFVLGAGQASVALAR